MESLEHQVSQRHATPTADQIDEVQGSILIGSHTVVIPAYLQRDSEIAGNLETITFLARLNNLMETTK